MAVPVRTDIFVVVGRNSASIILYLDQVETVVLETNLCDRGKDPRQLSLHRETERFKRFHIVPTDVAPASRLFSTSSLTTEQRSTIT